MHYNVDSKLLFSAKLVIVTFNVIGFFTLNFLHVVYLYSLAFSFPNQTSDSLEDS